MADLFSVYNNDAEYNIDVEELTDSSPRCEQPLADITLKNHQLALLRKCIDMENNNIKLKDSPSVANHVSESDVMTTRIGILGDRVGAGKSYVVLSLVKCNDITNNNDMIIRSSGYNNVIFKMEQKKKTIKTNVLVIPHNLVSQWTNYINTFSKDLKCIFINKKMLAKLEEDYEDVLNVDLVVVTSSHYNKFATLYGHREFRFQRVFFDEVDNLHIPGCRLLEARFTWMITASFGNILYPRGHAKYDPVMHRTVWSANGINNSGYLKNVFLDLNCCIPKKLFKLLVVKNNDEFIENSLSLPALHKNIIVCKTPNNIRILNGIVDKNIIECLNANDINAAISHINPSNKATEDNIVELMIDKYQKQITNFKLKIQFANEYIYQSEAEKQSEIQKCTKSISDLESKIKMIRERIKESEMCLICFDEIKTKTVTECCQNPFCFKCINLWRANNNTCPMCRSFLSVKELFIVQENAQQTNKTSSPIANDDEMSADHDKIKNMEILLKKRTPTSKFLIFSNNDYSLMNISPILYKMGIKYEHLKGNGNVIKCIVDRYKNGDVDCLLVNSRHYGSGLNLENTSDVIMFHKFDNEIEKQIIGRAHRYGRTTPLNVWYFLYENETASSTSLNT
jgi:SNF2 family DNA or RNA helicase